MTGANLETTQSTEAPRRVSTGGIAADQLRSIVERIERMQAEAAEIASDRRKDSLAHIV